MTRFVFITGGVVSSLGKGIASAALGALLQARGFTVRLRKLDPYINVDPGTMSPYQHGEVFVTDDGAETDLDLGHYERFTGVHADAARQRHHRPDLLRRDRQGAARRLPRRHRAGHPAHHRRDQGTIVPRHRRTSISCWCEIGGTVGDIESLPFLEAIRQLGNELGRERAMFVHLTLVPYIPSAGELKTKPTQHSVKELLNVGIQPQMLLCRCDRADPGERAAQDRRPRSRGGGLRRQGPALRRRTEADRIKKGPALMAGPSAKRNWGTSSASMEVRAKLARWFCRAGKKVSTIGLKTRFTAARAG